MKDREVVTKDNYKQIVLKRAIILCWILLAVCFVVKIFGGNFFNIICENERFIKVCSYIENTFWYYVIGFIVYMLGNYLTFKFVCPESRLKSNKTFICMLLFFVIWVAKNILNPIIPVAYAVLSTIIEWVLDICVLWAVSGRFWKSVLSIFMMQVFCIITMVVKNLGFGERISDNVLITLIYMIDYYIMLTISSLYSYEIYLRRTNMGIFGNNWWLHKDIAKLEAILPTLKNEDERKACEKRIAKLKEKEAKKTK